MIELGEHLDTFFNGQILKIAVAMAVWPMAGQKTSCV
jgi:hypothetical protein